MCGIAGFFGSTPVARNHIDQITSALAQRGPDAMHVMGWNKQWQTSDTPSNALIHTRLSIRDLRSVADQPMSNDGGNVWICFNGEVYGWEPLKDELISRGFQFKTHSDTEFILHAYEAWGIEMISRLRGMFAIVIVDIKKQKSYLIRDRIGLKPLVYHHSTERFAFSSTIRGLIPALPDDAIKPSAQGIDAYLTHRYIPAPLTILDSAYRLENGHYLEYDLNTGDLQKHRYWTPEPKPGNWTTTLDESIALRTVSDRPVGLFLSGGIDSTVLASCLAHEGHASQLTAFTARFSGSSMDESEVAAETAKALAIDHNIVEIPQDISNEQFSKIVSDLDDPFADPSSFPMWYLSAEASKHVKVVLGGDGGDEIFAGYKRYQKHLRSSWRKSIKIPGNPFTKLKGKPGKIYSEMTSTWQEAYALRFSGFTPAMRSQILNETPSEIVYWRDLDIAKNQETGLEQLLSIDMANYLPEYILRKGDLCGMAHGLELRCPLLDHELYQQFIAMPDDERFTTPAKQALLPYSSPREEVFKIKKRGFNPPLSHWLLNCWKERYQGLGDRLHNSSNGIINPEGVNHIIAQYLAGQNKLAEQVLQLLILDETLQGLFQNTPNP
jgi:asparagine synthase (glutamine-hydrolysing)